MRPSRFGVVALISALLLGCALNLYIIHIDPIANLNRGSPRKTLGYNPTDPLAPEIPVEMLDKYGKQNDWVRSRYLYHEEWFTILSNSNGIFTTSDVILAEHRFGIPLIARSEKAVRYYTSHTSGTLWPTKGNLRTPPAVTYHPLGLILNPIIYALPIWLIVMGVRWAFIARRSRKRARLGLCVGCAYELAGLGVCPECGRERG